MAVKEAKKESGKPSDPKTPAPAAAPKKGGKLKLVVLILVVASALGGGAFWYLNQKPGPQDAKPHATMAPVFQPLEAFTVNLQIEESAQFLQTNITLNVADSAAGDAIKKRMPEVRNTVLLLLSARKPSEILNVDGKRKLGSDITRAINAIFDPAGAKLAATAKPPADAVAAESAPDAAATPEKSDDPVAGTVSKVPVLGVLFTSFIVQ